MTRTQIKSPWAICVGKAVCNGKHALLPQGGGLEMLPDKDQKILRKLIINS